MNIKNLQKKLLQKKSFITENKASFERTLIEYIKSHQNKKDYPTPSSIITRSIDHVRPIFNIQRVRKKGRTFFIPFLYTEKLARIKVMKWMKEGSQNTRHKNIPTAQSLQSIFLESLNGRGVIKKKQKDLHQLARAHKASIRYRWW
jgi:ribosomal protein S7